MLERLTARRGEPLTAWIGRIPLRQLALTQEVFVVELEFLQRCPSDTGQLELGLFAGTRGLTALGDILHPTPRRLRHLIAGARKTVNIALDE